MTSEIISQALEWKKIKLLQLGKNYWQWDKIPKSAEWLQEVTSTNPEINAFPSKWKKPNTLPFQNVFLALNLLMLVACIWEKLAHIASNRVLWDAWRKPSWENPAPKVLGWKSLKVGSFLAWDVLERCILLCSRQPEPPASSRNLKINHAYNRRAFSMEGRCFTQDKY